MSEGGVTYRCELRISRFHFVFFRFRFRDVFFFHAFPLSWGKMVSLLSCGRSDRINLATWLFRSVWRPNKFVCGCGFSGVYVYSFEFRLDLFIKILIFYYVEKILYVHCVFYYANFIGMIHFIALYFWISNYWNSNAKQEKFNLRPYNAHYVHKKQHWNTPKRSKSNVSCRAWKRALKPLNHVRVRHVHT